MLGKVQTRRTISVKGTTYAKLREYASTHGESMSDIVERLLMPLIKPVQTPAPRPKVPMPEPTPAAAAERQGGAKLW